MGSTNAERQRRYRRHRAGDHSLCGPRCTGETKPDAVTSPVTQPVTSHAPRLGPRGQRLWQDMQPEGAQMGPGELVLLEEACRLADRLDRLDAILNGDQGEWMRFRVSEDGAEVTVTLDRALAEARQQQVALKQLVAELRQSRANGVAPKTTGVRPSAPAKEGAGDAPAGAISFAAALAAKRGRASTG